MARTYTTTKGTVWQYPLTRAQWQRIKRAAESRFDGSAELFAHCWRKYQNSILPGTDNPESIDDVSGWLDSIAADCVNNPKSKFYIYG